MISTFPVELSSNMRSYTTLAAKGSNELFQNLVKMEILGEG